MLTIIVHSKTHKGESHHEISRIASKVYTFPSFHTADSDLNCCYIFRTWCLILVTIVVTGCLPGALVAKDPSRNRLTLRKKCHNSLEVYLKATSSWSFLVFPSFWKGFLMSLLFRFTFGLYPGFGRGVGTRIPWK